MPYRFRKYVLRNEGENGGAPPPPPAAPAAPTPPAPAPGAPTPPAPAPTALGAAVASPTPPAPAAPTPAPEFKFADKVIVAKDGATDWEATARNAEQARQHLERKMGSGEAPPAAATDYKLTIPEALADKIKADDLSKDPGFLDLTSKLHAAGANQKLYDLVVSEFLTRGDAMRSSNLAMDAADCTTALKELDGWKSDAEYRTQINRAGAALKAYAGPHTDALMAAYGNDPRFCQMLASVGRELQEDSQANVEARQAASTTLESLQASKAYLNQNDPAHAQTVARVGELMKQVHGTKEVGTGRTMSFQT